MTNHDSIDAERQLLAEAEAAGGWTKYKVFFKLSGPGWMASAITLGGGSLASSLYLGVLGGYSLLWLQPFAMILGIVMLGAIGYVTLSTNEKPFRAINGHVSPVLGWGWALAVAAANIIWCMPQHSLAFGVLSQNLLTKTGWFQFGQSEGLLNTWARARWGTNYPWLADHFDQFLVGVILLILTTLITWSYDRGGWGLRLYELALKIIVAIIVLCFMGVVIRLTFSEQPLEWGKIFAGLIPDFSQFFHPTTTFQPFLDAIGEPAHAARQFWSDKIVSQQRDVMISAAATAVGINMTLMFPYSMLRKGWTKEFRGLCKFDLGTGMFIPFVLATSFVVIAAAASFHTQLPEGFERVMREGKFESLQADPQGPKYGAFQKLLAEREGSLSSNAETTNGNLDEGNPSASGDASEAERYLAAMLVKRDAFDLAHSLAPLTGKFFANMIFGFGVLAMVLSSISILMLISGFVYAEMLGFPAGGKVHKLGTLVAGIGGMLWPLFWAGESKFYLAIVTSVFGFMLLPFAYVTFVLLMNSKSLLGDQMPGGIRRFCWNGSMFFSASLITVAAMYMIWIKTGLFGVLAVLLFIKLVIMVWFYQRNSDKERNKSNLSEQSKSA
jgi:Mn2+/Fe2+ NRAMP family transporter